MWPGICAASSTVTIDFKIADIKLGSSSGLFAEVREKSVLGLQSYRHCLKKNAVFNINACRYLKGFYTYKKINNSFLKFDHSLLRMPKNIKSVKFLLPKNAISKPNQPAYK